MELAEAPMDSEGVTTSGVSPTLVRTLVCRRSPVSAVSYRPLT